MPEVASRPRCGDGLLCGCGALLVYLLLAQQSFYHTDGIFIVKRLLAGEAVHNNHFLYMPLLMGLQWVTQPLGLAAHEVASLFSALGVAVAVVLAHSTCRRLGSTRGRAVGVAATFALCGPVLFFATVVEFHGPFLAFAQLAFLVNVHFAQRPGVARLLLVAISGALAFCAHTSALLLPALLAPWFVAQRLADRRTPALGWAAASGVAHLAAVWLTLRLLQASGFPEFPPAYDRGRLGEMSLATLAHLPRLLWEEWWWALLPPSLALPAALLVRRTRSRGLALACGAGAFLALCLTLLVDPPRPERGAYLLPMVFAAALLTLELAPAALVFVSTAVLGVLGVVGHDTKGAGYDAFAAGFHRAVPKGDAMLWIADEDELATCLTRLPGVDYMLLSELASQPLAVVAPQLPALAAVVADLERRGRAVYVTERAERYLSDPAELRWGALLPSGPALVQALRTQFRRTPVGDTGFRAVRLQRP